MVDVLARVPNHDEQAVLTAVEMALDAGVPTKTQVLNLLHRLVDGKTTNGPDTPCVREVVRRSFFPLFLRWAG